jgi:hypothetical protein
MMIVRLQDSNSYHNQSTFGNSNIATSLLKSKEWECSDMAVVHFQMNYSDIGNFSGISSSKLSSAV